MLQYLDKRFHVIERGSTIGREIIGGLVTFMAMSYIIFVNPSILGATGMDHTALTLATCISAAIGTLLTAFMANVPFAQAPGYLHPHIYSKAHRCLWIFSLQKARRLYACLL